MLSKFSNPIHILCVLTLAGVVLILPGALVRAQSDGGLDLDPGSPGYGGRFTIEGHVYYPSGQKVDKRLRVRLANIRGGDFSTTTDESGAFTFRRLVGGSYYITVEAGKEYQPVNETVDIVDSSARSRFSFTTPVRIQLQYRESNSRPGVVNLAIAGVPKEVLELYQKALQSERAGDNEKAIDQLQRAIALHPRFPLALNKLGVIYQRLAKLDEAEKAFRNAIEIEPEVFELRLNYGIVLLRNKHYKEADTQFQRAIKMKDLPLAHLFRGKTLIHLGKHADAENELQTVIKLGGEEVAMAYRFLGALYNDRGESKRAIVALEKYLSLVPTARDAESVREIIKQLRTQTGS